MKLKKFICLSAIVCIVSLNFLAARPQTAKKKRQVCLKPKAVPLQPLKLLRLQHLMLKRQKKKLPMRFSLLNQTTRRINKHWNSIKLSSAKRILISMIPPEAAPPPEITDMPCTDAKQQYSACTSVISGDPKWAVFHTYISIQS